MKMMGSFRGGKSLKSLVSTAQVNARSRCLHCVCVCVTPKMSKYKHQIGFGVCIETFLVCNTQT